MYSIVEPASKDFFYIHDVMVQSPHLLEPVVKIVSYHKQNTLENTDIYMMYKQKRPYERVQNVQLHFMLCHARPCITAKKTSIST